MSQEIGNQNFKLFSEWHAQRAIDGDLNDYVRNGKLNKSEIAKELGFGRSVFSQNPQVKELAAGIDANLARKHEKAVTKETKELTEAREKADNRVARTEASNSKLLEKIAQLEEENRQLKLQLSNIEEFKTAREAFIEAGAVLR